MKSVEPISKHATHKVYYLWYVLMILFTGSIILVLYWLYSVPDQAFSLHQPIFIETKTVKADGFVIAQTEHYCKNIKTVGRISTSLIGEDVQLMLPPGVEAQPKGCNDNLRFALPIPPQATPGTYHFHFKTTYQVNPIKSLSQEYDTETFTVE